MHIIRWLMGHPIVAMVLLGVIALFYYLGNGNKEEAIASVQNTAQEQTVGLNNSAESSEISVSSDAKAKANNNEEATLASGANADVQKDTEADSSSNNSGAQVAAQAQTIAHAVNSTEETVDSSISQTGGVANQDTNKQTTTNVAELSKSDNGSIQDLGATSTEEMLLMAREAYWNNGLDEASQIYEQLIQIEPNVIDHRGELGNVYWRQGYPKKAAQLYSEIAIPMIEKGNSERVANMVGFIGLFYPDRAAEIHKRLIGSK